MIELWHPAICLSSFFFSIANFTPRLPSIPKYIALHLSSPVLSVFRAVFLHTFILSLFVILMPSLDGFLHYANIIPPLVPHGGDKIYVPWHDDSSLGSLSPSEYILQAVSHAWHMKQTPAALWVKLLYHLSGFTEWLRAARQSHSPVIISICAPLLWHTRFIHLSVWKVTTDCGLISSPLLLCSRELGINVTSFACTECMPWQCSLYLVLCVCV